MNRIQRVRRFRLASLAMTLGALLTVSGLPLAATTNAASGDTLRITAPAGSVGGAGATFTSHVITNTVSSVSGAQASVTFNPAVLQISSVTFPAGYWGSAPVQQGGDAPSIAAANISGDLVTVAASYLSGTHNSPAGDVPFIDITFSLVACPAGGTTPLGLPIGPADATFLGGSTYSGGYGASITPLAGDVTGATVTCTPVVGPDFTIGASPASLSIPQGGTDHTTVSTTAIGTAQVITLGSAGAPAGVTPVFGTGTITGTGSTSLTFTVGAAVPTGVYPITVTGTQTSGSHSTTVNLTVTLPAAGPPASSGQVTVTGTVDGGFLGLSVPANTSLFLNRNVTNTTNVPVLIFSNTQWTLSIADAMLAPKAAADRGHMTDTSASPEKVLAAPMQAYVPSPPAVTPVPGLLIRTLDVAGAQSLWGGTNSTTLPVTLSQLTQPLDPPGNYAIDVVFSAISGF